MNDTAPLDANGAITALAFPDGRRAAIEYIMAHAQEALPGLIAALEGGDPAAACRAAEALASLPEHTADTISPLGRQALYGPPAVAVAAVAALGNLPASRASVITLEEALRSERAEVRREAALSLARIEAQSVPALSRRAGTALTGLEADDVGAVCRAALVRLEPAPRARLFAAALQADLRAALEALDEGTARRTTADDAHELLLRPDILRALTRRLTPETAAILAAPVAVAGRALIDRAPHDAEIGHVVDAAALALLEALYVVREPIDRAPLLEALETLGPRAQRVLAGRLADEQPERVAPLAGVLAELDWRPTADQAGARYLIARGRWEECAAIGKEATGPLIEAFLESHAEQREQAAQALDRIGWRPTEERLQAPYLVALRRWEALDRLDGALAPHLAEEMAHERAEARRRRIPGYRLAVRLGLAESLARLGGPDAHEPLAAALAEDPAAAVRSAALRCLRRDGALDEDALVRRLEAEYAAAAALTEGAEPSEAARSEQEAASGLRAELIEALAATGGDRALEALLRAHAMEAESLPRGAVEAALAAVAERSPERAVAAVRDALEQGEPETLGDALALMGEAPAQALATRLGNAQAGSGGGESARAATALVAFARAGGAVEPLLRPLLLGGSPEARLAAARVYDRLDRVPTGRDEAAAYWLAKGQWDRCEAIGEPAIPVLTAALPTYDWRTAAAIGMVLLRLGADRNAAMFDALISRLRQVVARPDERLQPPPPDGEEARGRRPPPIIVRHEEERQTARAYITAIEGLRSKR